MTTNKHAHKTFGHQTSNLIMSIYEMGKDIFTLSEASKITGLKDQSLLNHMSRLNKNGVVTRLMPGMYKIVPLQMGRATEYLGNPYLVAREIIVRKFKKKRPVYYISHSSAMDLHQMVTQPQLVVYATTTKQIKKQNILGTPFHFITAPSQQMIGIKKHWVDKTEQIFVSDLEKTILDGLKMPEYCGGITEVAKGFWIKRGDIDVERLVNYALKLNIGAIYRRLGFLLEIYQINCPNEIKRLNKKMSSTYLLLDPGLPSEGKYFKRWMLRLNITSEELLAQVRT
ncbi:MAG: transcriptional regulator [Deltaproteobacteria bacterium]|nr:transcriptional regulator [Deltaproteobacteria bacterium]